MTFTTLNGFSSHWLDAILRASWEGSLFVLTVALTCALCRRIPAHVRYWLWWLACAKLILSLCFSARVALPVLPVLAPAASLAAAAAPLPIMAPTPLAARAVIVSVPQPTAATAPTAPLPPPASALPIAAVPSPIHPHPTLPTLLLLL